MLPIQRKISSYNYTSGNNITYLVIHDVGTVSTAKNNVDYFSGGNRGASAHYFIDDISIWQSVEDRNGAWHVGDGYGKYGITNTNSIGIEMCLKAPLTVTDKTVTNTIELVQYLMTKYNIPASRVVRHYDASRKSCPGSMQGNNWAKWNEFKKKLSGNVTTPETGNQGGSNVATQKPTSYIKGDKVVISPTAKSPLTTPARHFSRAEFKTTWTVESRNGLTLILKDNNSSGKLTVKDTDVVYMPTNDIGFMDTVRIKQGVNNWRGGKVMSQGAKNATYSVRIRDGRNLFIDDSWGNEGWVMDSQVERVK